MAVNVPQGMPAPSPNTLDLGFWDAAAEGRLVVQRCEHCGRHRFPPTVSCYACQSVDWTWDELPGHGVIASFIWLPHRDGGANGAPPRYYNVALIELAGTVGDPVRMLSNVVDAWDRGELAVGQHVELDRTTSIERSLPLFRSQANGPQ